MYLLGIKANTLFQICKMTFLIFKIETTLCLCVQGENDDDIIDFKLDEHDAEMFCLENNLESSYAEGSHSKSSMSPVSSTSSGSCYGKLINKNVIVSKNLPLAQILRYLLFSLQNVNFLSLLPLSYDFFFIIIPTSYVNLYCTPSI